MKPSEGRLQTSEHILARTVENKVEDVTVVIARFPDTHGIVEFSSTKNLRELDWDAIEQEVNEVITRDLTITITHLERKDAEQQFDLSRIPEALKEIRIVSIQDFDTRPCKDPHASHTSEIGRLRIESMKRVGKDRYRVRFSVSEPPQSKPKGISHHS